MGSKFKSVPLEKVLKRAKRTHSVDSTKAYNLLGVRWYGNGAHLHAHEKGSELKTKTLYEIRPGDVTYNKMWVKKGAFAVVDKHLNNLYATSEYPTFEPNPDRLNSKYFRYVMSTPRFVDDASAYCNGTTSRARLHPNDFLKLEVALPPLPEQKKIAAILSSVDEAIEATEAVIEQTRTVKKGLLQELLTRGIGHTEFKKTAIGEIPRSWEVRAVENLADVIDPQPSHRTPPQDDNGIPYIGMGDINDDGVINFENARKVNVAVLHEHQT